MKRNKYQHTNEALIFKINNFNALTREIERFKAQENILKRMSWICHYVFANTLFVTVYGYLAFQNKAIELKRKSETCHKAMLNLLQQAAFHEGELKREGEQIHKAYSNSEGSIRNWVETVRQNKEIASDDDHKLLYFVDKFDFDSTTNGLEPYEEILFYKSALDLYKNLVSKS